MIFWLLCYDYAVGIIITIVIFQAPKNQSLAHLAITLTAHINQSVMSVPKATTACLSM